ncbi:hypothetical protein [Runella rosea]|uniref:hypothetical protein n=1 Tax=Runella rosea TaxID=2259595 RepID=UPI0013B3FEFC|nr:hypothetical protein [Runella rosea]
METQNNDRKIWAKPVVLALNINKDTYTSDANKDKETGKGDAANLVKNIPS